MTKTATKTFQAINQLHPTEARWFALYTGYKHEKMAVKLLQKKGIEAYLPLQSVTRHYAKKTKKLNLPLINCYVFACITTEEYLSVLQTEYVLGFVRQRKDLIAIPEREIKLLRQIVGELDVEVNERTLVKGDRVEVVAGQLTGIQGVLEEIRGAHKLIVSLETLGYDLRIEINPKHLRVLA